MSAGAQTPPMFSKSFTDSSIMVGETTSLIFTIDNTANDTAALDLEFIDPLPTGLTFASPLNLNNTCSAIVTTIVSSTATLDVTAGSVSAASSCIISVDVLAVAPGTQINTTGDLTSTLGNSGTATATLIITPLFMDGFEAIENQRL